MSKRTDGAKVTEMTQTNGTRWVKVQAPFGGARFNALLDEVAAQYGVVRGTPGIRVANKAGKTVWETQGATQWVTSTTGYSQTYNTAGFFLR